MAGFKTHISTSTTLGVMYGGAGLALLRGAEDEIPISTCLIATGLCSLSGMLPDLDSDSGIPLRETITFTAAVVPMLLIDRLSNLGMSTETIVLVGGLLYLAIRFGIFTLLKRYTVHRGMFHSLPAALIAGTLAYLLCSASNEYLRLYKAGAVLLGFLSHLALDELYAIEWRRGRWRLKKSFGTALKLWGSSTSANISTYAKLLILLYVAIQDPTWMQAMQENARQGKLVPRVAIEAMERVWR